MSNAIFDTTITHGTPEGFDAGCRSGGACPAIEFGLTCKTAKSLSRSDFRYQRLNRQDFTPQEIADQLGLNNTPAPPTKPSRKKTTTTGPTPTPEPAPEIEPMPTPATTNDAHATDATHDDDQQTQDTTTPPAPTMAEIRAWATRRGYDVAPTGRVRTEIIEHYWQAHGLLDPTPPAAPAVPEAPALVAPLNDAHPEWATVTTSADVEQARSLTARLWDENHQLEHQITTLTTELTNTKTALETAEHQAHTYENEIARLTTHNNDLTDNTLQLLPQTPDFTLDLIKAVIALAAAVSALADRSSQ